jgi:site-specific recombinase XerD
MKNTKRIGLRDLRALKPNQEIWDAAVAGFGARRRTGTTVAFVLMYRNADGRLRRHTIGRLGSPWTPDTARLEAVRLLGEVAKGGDPAQDKQGRRKADTVAELCDLYVSDAEAGRILGRGGRPKKPSTVAFDRGAIEGHIKPLLGSRTVVSVTKADIERFMHAVADGKTASTRKTKPRGVSRVRGGRGIATRVVGLMGGVFTFAVDHQMRPDNPVSRVRKFAEGRRERRLTDEECAKLGAALTQADATVWPAAVACMRFLALTGWRAGEALSLRWRDVDLVRRVAILPDTKSGRSVRPLSNAACDALKGMTRLGDDKLVFPASRGDGMMSGFKRFSRRIVAMAGLPRGVTPHVLRHSFASLAADLGLSEPTVGALIGHKGSSTTSRYMHSADAVLLAAADQVARRTVELLGETSSAAKVVELRAASA